MKELLIEILVVAFVVSGCGSWQGADVIQETFFNRTIIYRIDPGAQKQMRKIKGLLFQVYEKAGEEIPLPDEIILPIYRDADMNRNYHISSQEAESFYTEFIIQFEDSLGPIKFNPGK